MQNMISLNYKGLQQLTSLRKSEIECCPNLQSNPEEGLPSSISFLSIWKCPLLERRCQQEGGEDWPKNSHIPT
ncbi:conserved hypothetical protein [Ricinus communis]|uniref:Uncharacterized protein n=2 Tax=Ricinus communis TaxID=3988 RepID=B9S5W9_RICCO|nr:conserved hypothetical protein [Ricinus communis]